MRFRSCMWLVACGVALCPLGVGAQEGKPGLILQVIRLKPGDVKRVELALPSGDFRPSGKSGRDFFGVEVLPKKGTGAKAERLEAEKKATFHVSSGLDLVWVEDRPEVELRAGKDVKPGTTDLRVTYESFAFGSHVAGFRIIIAAE